MTNESGRAKRCPTCGVKTGCGIVENPEWTETNNVRRRFISCSDIWHDALPAASTGTPEIAVTRGAPPAAGWPEPGSAEQFTINDGVRLIKKLEACEGMEAKLVLLRMFGDKYAASLRAQLQERGREIEQWKFEAAPALRLTIEERERDRQFLLANFCAKHGEIALMSTGPCGLCAAKESEATIQGLRGLLSEIFISCETCLLQVEAESVQQAGREQLDRWRAEAALAQPGAGKDQK